MRARIRASGEVGVEQPEAVGGGVADGGAADLDEPDEARSEHGLGLDDELLAQGLDGGEGLGEGVAEGLGHGLRVGRQVLEEEVVVVGGRGVVEGQGVVGVGAARRGEDDGF